MHSPNITIRLQTRRTIMKNSLGINHKLSLTGHFEPGKKKHRKLNRKHAAKNQYRRLFPVCLSMTLFLTPLSCVLPDVVIVGSHNAIIILRCPDGEDSHHSSVDRP